LVADPIDWASSVAVKRNKLQPILGSINIPANTVAGQYKGIVAINAGKGNSSAIDDAVNYYVNTRSVNPLQVTIGVPFYGVEYTTYSSLGASTTGILRATRVMYNEFISKGGFIEMWDNVSQHSYYVNSSTNRMIVYDNEKDRATKGACLKSKGLKDAMIWELLRGFYDMGTTKKPWLQAQGTSCIKIAVVW
jgi:chitinase